MRHRIDAYAPGEIAGLVNRSGVNKANRAFIPLATPGFLAGIFIALTAYPVPCSDTLELADGTVHATTTSIANHKVNPDYMQAFVSGLLCNALVCSSSMASHTVSGKILAIILAITAFDVLDFEYSIANRYFPVLFCFSA